LEFAHANWFLSVQKVPLGPKLGNTMTEARKHADAGPGSNLGDVSENK